ncbi:hypothetical protein ANO11243_001430 [Dothideomycetidae sp. 11243]|nr:hypothetical protein ANO11243_001430 [fungal sp. No.11243]
MKVSSTLALLSTVALAAASFRYNVKDNSFTCGQSTGLAAYCAGGPIIIRCNNGVGYAGNCNDNLAGEPPIGDDGNAGCYQTSTQTGDAACTKAGLVYPASGSGANPNASPFPVPGSYMPSNTTSLPSNSTRMPIPITTGSPSNSTSPYRWSNSTTVTVSPVPAYTAGSSPSPAAPSSSVEAFTGAASALKLTSTCWALGVIALVALVALV